MSDLGYITKKELARRWGISVRQIENLVSDGSLKRPARTPRKEAEPGKRRLLRWDLAYIAEFEAMEGI